MAATSRALVLSKDLAQERAAAAAERDSAKKKLELHLARAESGPAARARAVLIVDDEPAVGRVLRTILERSIPAVIDVVETIEAAEQRCRVIAYDLLLVDMRLHNEPEGGARLIEAVKKRSRSATAKIVLITGHSDPARTTEDLCLIANADTCLKKPIDSPLLVDTVRGMLGMVANPPAKRD